MIMYKGKQVYTNEEVANLYECNKSQINRALSVYPIEFKTEEYFFNLHGKELEAVRVKYPELNIPKGIRNYKLWTWKGIIMLSKGLYSPGAWKLFYFLMENSVKESFVLMPLIEKCPKGNVEDVIEWYKSAGEAYTKVAFLMENSSFHN